MSDDEPKAEPNAHPPLREAVDWVGRKARGVVDGFKQKYRRQQLERATRLLAFVAIAYLLLKRDA